MTRVARFALHLAVLLAVVATSPARAQGTVPEARIDGIIAHRGALQAALGLDIPVSSAMRLELAAGAGPSFSSSRSSNVSARADAVIHFLLAPRHLMRWSPYAGGGVGARYDGAKPWRAVAIVVAGVNAPRWKHTIPFFEAGLGGGFRIGAGLRRDDAPRGAR